MRVSQVFLHSIVALIYALGKTNLVNIVPLLKIANVHPYLFHHLLLGSG